MPSSALRRTRLFGLALLLTGDPAVGWKLTRALLTVGAHRAQSRSTTQSMQPVSASTSSGSTAGNIATRSWLRPSLR